MQAGRQASKRYVPVGMYKKGRSGLDGYRRVCSFIVVCVCENIYLPPGQGTSTRVIPRLRTCRSLIVGPCRQAWQGHDIYNL